MYFIIRSIYFRVNLKMKTPTLCCFTCFFISFVLHVLYFTVAFLLIRKTWHDQFAGKVGRWGILRNWWILVMGGGGGGGGWRDDFEMGGGSFMDCFSFSLIDLAKQLLGIRLASDWAMTII